MNTAMSVSQLVLLTCSYKTWWKPDSIQWISTLGKPHHKKLAIVVEEPRAS